MKLMSVKKYSELVGKSDKTIYKQIKKGTLEAVKVKKGYQVCVDANLLKCLGKMEKALEEAKNALKKLEEEQDEKSKKTGTAKAAPKKTAVKQPLKKSTAKTAPKKSVKKSTTKPAAKKTLKKSPLKKRK